MSNEARCVIEAATVSADVRKWWPRLGRGGLLTAALCLAGAVAITVVPLLLLQ